MRNLIRGAGILALAAGAGFLTPAAIVQAADADAAGPARAVFVQTNDPSGNAIVAYRRNADGTLTPAGTYATGGRGGKELPGTQSDPLGSQGSLVYDAAHRLLLAVNAGSDSVSVFRVDGDRLELSQVLASGGPFPTGIALHANLVYVLDAGLAGFVSGYRIQGRSLQPIPGSTRTLGLPNTDPPFFLSSPGEIGFTPSGGQLLVTTKANGTVDVFAVSTGGQLSAQPVRNPEGPVPFAFTFEPAGLLTLVNAGASSVGTFRVERDGTLTPAGAPVSDGQAAACWIVSLREFDYVANTGSGDVSQYRVSGDGSVTVVNPAAASGIPGAIDMASAAGRFLYVESGGSGSVEVFAVAPAGSLTLIQSVAVPDGGSLEGIVAG